MLVPEFGSATKNVLSAEEKAAAKIESQARQAIHERIQAQRSEDLVDLKNGVVSAKTAPNRLETLLGAINKFLEGPSKAQYPKTASLENASALEERKQLRKGIVAHTEDVLKDVQHKPETHSEHYFADAPTPDFSVGEDAATAHSKNLEVLLERHEAGLPNRNNFDPTYHGSLNEPDHNLVKMTAGSNKAQTGLTGTHHEPYDEAKEEASKLPKKRGYRARSWEEITDTPADKKVN